MWSNKSNYENRMRTEDQKINMHKNKIMQLEEKEK